MSGNRPKRIGSWACEAVLKTRIKSMDTMEMRKRDMQGVPRRGRSWMAVPIGGRSGRTVMTSGVRKIHTADSFTAILPILQGEIKAEARRRWAMVEAAVRR